MDEESVIAGAVAAASSLQNMMHTFDSDGEQDDQEPDGLFSDLTVEEEEEEREKQLRRSYPRPEYWRSTWGKWVLKLRELNAAEGGVDPECREAVQFAGALPHPFRVVREHHGDGRHHLPVFNQRRCGQGLPTRGTQGV